MDRNDNGNAVAVSDLVALRKESVDRNGISGVDTVSHQYVALRKESVDRNDVIRPAIDVFLASLSARRAWIEMPKQLDRPPPLTSRSPQGERG